MNFLCRRQSRKFANEQGTSHKRQEEEVQGRGCFCCAWI